MTEKLFTGTLNHNQNKTNFISLGLDESSVQRLQGSDSDQQTEGREGLQTVTGRQLEVPVPTAYTTSGSKRSISEKKNAFERPFYMYLELTHVILSLMIFSLAIQKFLK